MTRIHGYSEVFGIAHKVSADVFDGHVVVQEKIDGSQISFGVYGGELAMRSKGKQIVVDAPDSMFEAGVASVKERASKLPDGWTFRGEYLRKPKHNSLAYERIPRGHIALYDIDQGDQNYLPQHAVCAWANRLEFDHAPVIVYADGRDLKSQARLIEYLASRPLLGGAMIEGIVIKNYAKFGPDKKTLMVKFVADKFREIHQREWKASNPKSGDIVQELIEDLRTEARFEKAVQHLRDIGQIEGDPRDIGKLIKEVQADIRKECRDYIADKLVEWALPKIVRGASAGVPEWYKAKLEAEVLGN